VDSETSVRSVDQVLQPVRWANGAVELLDQTRLPGAYATVCCSTVQDVANAIREMTVRGAPAIGVTAAYGYTLGAWHAENEDSLAGELESAHATLLATRPTAVNLGWALDRMRGVFELLVGAGVDEVRERLLVEATHIQEESYRADYRLSELGAELLAGRKRILTHCNAGPLATAGYGTAVGVIRKLYERDHDVSVLADETRPFLQGARLTAWELMTLGIPVTIITDSMAGSMMQRDQVDAVITGADRVAANGDVANKIGTYSLAVLAGAHGIPFFVAAPMSTVDLATPNGAAIPIETRGSGEVTSFRGEQVAPEGARAHNPAFDVTPHHLIAAIITENGIATDPLSTNLARLVNHENESPPSG